MAWITALGGKGKNNQLFEFPTKANAVSFGKEASTKFGVKYMVAKKR